MAADGLFVKGVARVSARTHVPVTAVALQGAAAVAIALTGNYGRILDTVVSADWIFFGLTAACVFRLRAADAGAGRPAMAGIPGHPGPVPQQIDRPAREQQSDPDRPVLRIVRERVDRG